MWRSSFTEPSMYVLIKTLTFRLSLNKHLRNSFATPRSSNTNPSSGGGGVAFLVRRDVSYSRLPTPFSTSDPHSDFLFISVSVYGSTFSFLNVYSPPIRSSVPPLSLLPLILPSSSVISTPTTLPGTATPVLTLVATNSSPGLSPLIYISSMTLVSLLSSLLPVVLFLLRMFLSAPLISRLVLPG